MSLDLAVDGFLRGAPVALVHAAVAAGITGLAASAYFAITPHQEVRLLRQGNVASALSAGAAIVGLALTIASAMRASVLLVEVALWGALAAVVQIGVFFAVDLIVKDLSKRIEEGEIAAAAFLAAIKISVALIVSAAVTG